MTIITRTFATRRLLVVALAGAVSLAACGSSSASGSGDSATTAKAAAASESSTGSSAAGSSTASTAAKSSDSTAKSASAGDTAALADGMVSAFNAVAKGDCGKAKDISEDMDVNPAGADATAGFAALGKALDKLASSGPSDLRADFGVMAKAFSGMAKAYEELGLGGDPSKLSSVMSDPAKAAELAKLGEQMNSADVQAASDHVSKWIEEKCPGLENS